MGVEELVCTILSAIGILVIDGGFVVAVIYAWRHL